MSHMARIGFALLLLLLLGNSSGNYAAQSKQKSSDWLDGNIAKNDCRNR